MPHAYRFSTAFKSAAPERRTLDNPLRIEIKNKVARRSGLLRGNFNKIVNHLNSGMQRKCENPSPSQSQRSLSQIYEGQSGKVENFQRYIKQWNLDRCIKQLPNDNGKLAESC